MDRKYAVILGNLGKTRDRFCEGYKERLTTLEMLRQAASIPRIQGVELVGTWDITSKNVSEVSSFLSDQNLSCVSIIPDLFTAPEYSKGSLCSNQERIRSQAIDSVMLMADLAHMLGCPLLNLWPGQDGYDYLLCSAYDKARDRLSSAIRVLAERNPTLQFALEYKPKEPRTHSLLARMADTLLVCNHVGLANVGVTIDTGHAFMAGEVVGESIALAKTYGDRLFHMHFNDNHTTTDDDMIVGSVHSVAFFETLFWLQRCEYKGWLSMDQYPYRENGPDAISESIEWVEQFALQSAANFNRTSALVESQDVIATSRALREMLMGIGSERTSG